MKLRTVIFTCFLAAFVFASCGGDSTDNKDVVEGAKTEMKQAGDAIKSEVKDAMPDASKLNVVGNDAIATYLGEFLKDASSGQVPVPEVLGAEASWEDKITKLMSDEGVASKLTELGDSPEAIVKKLMELAKK